MNNKRIHKLNMKISDFEKRELNKLMKEEKKSISDLVRVALRNTYDVEGFEASYEVNIFNFNNRRKSIYDKR
ncbi:ribbon-helix-helix protein, CopG family [uncultured Clostridium sp.]|uniref:ribbon-helix-helix protein, CopG family n=1 Tax=uncultured Clostridium sp. TaxID=59620 RepID=UPI0025FA05F3|nr:ribbon-helix-helix protein, CopG family [uncultured Clostridium sp.]